MNTKHSLIDIIRYGNTKKDKDDKIGRPPGMTDTFTIGNYRYFEPH